LSAIVPVHENQDHIHSPFLLPLEASRDSVKDGNPPSGEQMNAKQLFSKCKHAVVGKHTDRSYGTHFTARLGVASKNRKVPKVDRAKHPKHRK